MEVPLLFDTEEEIRKCLNCTKKKCNNCLYRSEKPERVYRKAVHQIDLESGRIVNTFPSATDAAKVTGIQRTQIYRCVHGKSSSAGGYKWQFVQGETKGEINDNLQQN